MIGHCDSRARRGASRRYLGVLGGTAIAAAVALAAGVPATAAAGAPASGGWSRPRVLSAPPGVSGDGYFTALSCASRSDCTAVGILEATVTTDRLFAITERRGAWGRAVAFAAPFGGTKANFDIFPVLSCASAGNCVVGDDFFVGRRQGAFVVSETNGTWGKPRELRDGADAISCPAPGDCTALLAGGDVLNERRGSWRTAFPLPGLAALTHGQFGASGVISCPSPGNCSVAGSIDNPAGEQGFVVTERRGIWGNAKLVRSQLTDLEIGALSCSGAGYCVAGGLAVPLAGGSEEAFTVTEAHGTWGAAEALPGIARRDGQITQLACPAAGACTALGNFSVGQATKLFVATEKNGSWRNPQTIAGAGDGLANSVGMGVDQLACFAVGSCVLADDTQAGPQAATAAQVNGRWGPLTVVPGILATDNGANSALEAVSCPARSRCTAVGSFGVLVSGRLFATTQR